MLRLSEVEASYGSVPVLFGIDFEVHPGEIVALLGTNGAGKTTILRVISGLLRPTSGTVEWNGRSLVGLRPPEIVKRGLLQVPGGRGVFPGMTVQENLEMGGFLYGRDGDRRARMVDEALGRFPVLKQRLSQRAGSLSGGEQQMLVLAKSLVMVPKLILIDELSLGLAPKVVEDLVAILRDLNERGISFVIVDQHVDLALDIASRAYFIERGAVKYSGRAEGLRGRDDLLRSVFLTGAFAEEEVSAR